MDNSDPSLIAFSSLDVGVSFSSTDQPKQLVQCRTRQQQQQQHPTSDDSIINPPPPPPQHRPSSSSSSGARQLSGAASPFALHSPDAHAAASEEAEKEEEEDFDKKRTLLSQISVDRRRMPTTTTTFDETIIEGINSPLQNGGTVVEITADGSAPRENRKTDLEESSLKSFINSLSHLSVARQSTTAETNNNDIDTPNPNLRNLNLSMSDYQSLGQLLAQTGFASQQQQQQQRPIVGQHQQQQQQQQQLQQLQQQQQQHLQLGNQRSSSYLQQMSILLNGSPSPAATAVAACPPWNNNNDNASSQSTSNRRTWPFGSAAVGRNQHLLSSRGQQSAAAFDAQILDPDLYEIVRKPESEDHLKNKLPIDYSEELCLLDDRMLEQIVPHLASHLQPSLLSASSVIQQIGLQIDHYSRKVFVGGLPPDIAEEEIVLAFRRFGPLVIDWPHKAESKSYFPPKGYCFLLFQDELSVHSLINACVMDEGKLYWCVCSPTMVDKPVQIRPWNISDSDFVMDGTQPLDPRKTIFVGGVPRPLKAVELAMIMDNLYGCVCYAGIDTDPELKYPKGAGRVAFSNQQSYIAAISARFVQLQHGEIDKRVEVKPYVLDDQLCDECQGVRCAGKFAPFFCANVACLQYYCERCWAQIHSRPGREFHKPLVKEGADRPRSLPFRWS